MNMKLLEIYNQNLKYPFHMLSCSVVEVFAKAEDINNKLLVQHLNFWLNLKKYKSGASSVISRGNIFVMCLKLNTQLYFQTQILKFSSLFSEYKFKLNIHDISTYKSSNLN